MSSTNRLTPSSPSLVCRIDFLIKTEELPCDAVRCPRYLSPEAVRGPVPIWSRHAFPLAVGQDCLRTGPFTDGVEAKAKAKKTWFGSLVVQVSGSALPRNGIEGKRGKKK